MCGTPLTVLELARKGYRVSREPLWLLMGLLAAEPAGFGCEAEGDDDMPPEAMTGPGPGWAVDSFGATHGCRNGAMIGPVPGVLRRHECSKNQRGPDGKSG